MTLDALLSELCFFCDVELVLREKLSKSQRSLAEIAETAYCGDNFDFPLCKRMPLSRLAVVLLLLPEKYEEYRALGASDEIILDTFRDVSLRANLYYRKTGKAGISKEDVIWFRHIMNAEIFQIGTLQFQPFEMLYLDEETVGEPYMSFSQEQMVALPAGSPVLNCHIPYGADISRQSVKKSLADAGVFFKTHFPSVRYKAFLCYSWLLYPPMLKCLSEKSNIKQFSHFFTVIGTCHDPEQAMDNLFVNGKNSPPSGGTTLQKMAREKKELFGFACGILPI